MTRLFIILSTLVFSVLFMFFPVKGEIGFLFSDMVLPGVLWFYYFFEHVIVLMLAVVILIGANEYRTALKVFVFIELIDTIDYCLTYGEPWFDSLITWNMIKVALFGSVILYEKYAK